MSCKMTDENIVAKINDMEKEIVYLAVDLNRQTQAFIDILNYLNKIQSYATDQDVQMLQAVAIRRTQYYGPF